jgi:hypothetical protein
MAKAKLKSRGGIRMPYDPNAAQVELNKLISDVNATLGTHLKFVSVGDVVQAVNDPRGTTSSVVDQVNRTPDQQIASIAEAVTSNPGKLGATVTVVENDLKASPNLTAAFDEARTKISDSDFLKLISPLEPKLSIPVSHGGTVYNLILQNVHLLPIRF